MFQLVVGKEAPAGISGTCTAVKRPFNLAWYAAVVFLGLTLVYIGSLNTNSYGAQRMSLTDTLMKCMMPGGAAGSVAASRVSQAETAVGALSADFHSHVACFSDSGKWVFNGEPRYIVPNKFGSVSLRQCENRFLNTTQGAVAGDEANEVAARGDGANWIVREELKWEWRTDEQRCPLQELDRDEFCRRIGPGRNILVVGDSINQELYWILLNHLVVNTSGWRLPRSAGERLTRGDLPVCEDVLGPGHGFRVGFVRNDRLSLALRVLEDRHANFYEYPWADAVEPWNISLLLLNKGAHYESDANFTQSLTNTLAVVKSRWPGVEVVYRSTPPGHPGCADRRQPLPERQPADELRRLADRYHWADFAEQNRAAERITRRFGYVYIDLDGVLATRPDGHYGANDCLHYCVPGPLDVFAKLFYNTLFLMHP